MVRQYQRLNGYEFEQALRDSEWQRNLARFSLQGGKESDSTEHAYTNVTAIYAESWN